MKEILIKSKNSYSKILVGESIANLKNYLPTGRKAIIITDKNVLRLYRHFLEGFNIIEIEPGEKNKTLSTIDNIMGQLLEFETDRSSFIVGVGGGIVSDITGFAASVYMRGLHFGFVSTSLLSQVDASVGGKNGVNYKGFKNMVGVFKQPDFVICDLNMLKTLDRSEFLGGFAEIIKHGAIKSIDYFKYLEENYLKALDYDLDVLSKIVYDSIIIKSKVVEQDEHEKDERRKLNFGHTFGHAIEKLTAINHGQAISIGMCMAADVSVKKGFLPQSDSEHLKKLIQNLQLPVTFPYDKSQLFNAMKKDKKREGKDIHLVLLKELGNAVVSNITYKELEEIIYDMR